FPCRNWKAEMIAHELAHACLFAVRSAAHSKPWPKASPDECTKVGKEREQEVHALLKEWGYAVSYLQEAFAWCQETDCGTNQDAKKRWKAHSLCSLPGSRCCNTTGGPPAPATRRGPARGPG